MIRVPLWLWTVAGVLAFFLFAAGALYYANDWWLSGIVSVLILIWLAGSLTAFYSPPARRAVMLGALVCSFLYILLALGPWFSAAVGPWLLTTRALTTVETQWLGRQPEPQVSYQFLTTTPYVQPGGYSGSMPPSGFGGGWITPTTSYAPASGPSTFVLIGHWLCGVLAAATGALAAAWISRRHPRHAPGENPFAAQPAGRISGADK
jgi:hypothetical protein